MRMAPLARVQFRLDTRDTNNAFADLRRTNAGAPIRRQATRSMKGLSLDSLAGLAAAKGAALTRMVILAGIAYTMASTALFFVPAQQPVVPAVEAAPTAPQATRGEPTVDIDTIVEANFFGDAEAAEEAAAAEPAVETRLPLTLNGVFVARERQASAAIIAERNKRELLYQIGEKVPGNAVLQSVEANHVVLLRAGAQEILRFPETEEFQRIKGAAKPSAPRRPETSLAASRRNQPRPADDAPKDFVASFLKQLDGDEKARGERRALLEEARQEAIRAKGFRVGELAQLPYFKQNGLEAGDMILSMNGQPVADMEMSEAALAKLLASGPIQLEVHRAGQLLSLTASAKP